MQKKNKNQTTLFKELEMTEKQKELQELMFENKSALKRDKKNKQYKKRRENRL